MSVSNCPVVVQAAVDAVEVADDQPRQPGRRVDLREGDLVAGAGDLGIRAGRDELPGDGVVHRREGGAGAGVDEAGVVVDVQGRVVVVERLVRAADEVQVRGGVEGRPGSSARCW